ncbi:uncharacterized protein LOC108113101 [Drosophila eugracilis]|uniref:uncharacterized protein LOC108113101 n=1 Tax=Drosophila eugracilis TaxID=29029 RepID=UPI001BDAFE0F|nr:uncharacterized protein LOC108113101 [Drosophila eugracilis]
MCVLKIILVAISILVVENLALHHYDPNGSTIFGVVRASDRLMVKEEIVEPRRFFRIVKKDVYFKPQPFKISGIVATDNSDEKGGRAALLEGGPGSNFAMIQLKSARSRGLNFTLDIYTEALNCLGCTFVG